LLFQNQRSQRRGSNTNSDISTISNKEALVLPAISFGAKQKSSHSPIAQGSDLKLADLTHGRDS
jgi:hypothetical protein